MENGSYDMASYLSFDHNRICRIWQIFNADKSTTTSHLSYYSCFSTHYGVYFNTDLAEIIGQLVEELKNQNLPRTQQYQGFQEPHTTVNK